jgi:hypothetical protein
MADIGVPFDVAEKILGHKLPGVAHVYDRGHSGEQQRSALHNLANHLQQLTTGKFESNVVPIAIRTGKS